MNSTEKKEFVEKSAPSRDAFFPSDTAFLQSEIWQRVQEDEGLETRRSSEVFFVVKNVSPVGKYWYAPRAPMQCSGETWKHIGEFAKKENVSWLRVEPLNENALIQLTRTFGEKRVLPTYDVQPHQTFGVDLSRTEEELLADMKPKTRYNARLALKKKVDILEVRDMEYLDRFHELIVETADRAGVRPHDKEHYRTLLKLIPRENMTLYCAKYKEKIIAINMVVFFGSVAIYLHGASSGEFHQLMAPFALQWRAMLDAKERGCAWYDLGGVSMDGSHETLAGVTRFKKGFALKHGCLRTFPGTYDIILSPWKYKCYKNVRALKSLPRSVCKQIFKS
jgi:lipid II:glycine glycyltransferase (peptidoglycan interpeptide bridge formation enzyme)